MIKMLQKNSSYFSIFGGLLLFFIARDVTFAQENRTYFKFPVTQDGVYQLNLSQATSMGFQNLDEVGIFGVPGMLPQLLDSTAFELQPVPTKVQDEKLYFFLQGPHYIFHGEEGFDLQVHHYTDTLFYLIGKKSPGQAIITHNESAASGPDLTAIFGVELLKWEETNLLNSGRVWYSRPIFNRERLSFNFSMPTVATGPPELSVKVMGQSLSEGRMEFFHNNAQVGQVSISSIPNTPFGIKGREAFFRAGLQNANNYNIQVNFSSADVNGTGYLNYSLLAFPFTVANAPAGTYISKQSGIIRSRQDLTTWLVKDFYDVREVVMPELAQPGDRIILFKDHQTLGISDWKPIDLRPRMETERSQMIIISAPNLVSQANRLASHKQEMGISTAVYTPQQLYDAFAYGTKDISAFRNFLAYHYMRSGNLKHVLFFGKGTFDYKGILGGRPNLVPTYSSRNSLNPLTTFSSDDYFGFLELGQGSWEESSDGDELLRIGVGRIPAIDFRDANEAVNKIIAYEKRQHMEGTWKRRISFFADDGDNNIHLNDAETHANFIRENHPEFEISKLYLDRFEQVRENGIQRSPDARQALKEQIADGLLILNYIGHGNETTLTEERVFTVADLRDWPENPLLPLFITATCEFGRQDSPFIRSGAEELLFAERKGAIGLLTTGRPVFSSINFALNKAFIASVFQAEEGILPDLGTVFKNTKNNSLNGPFNRNFALIGDPSLRLAVPEIQAKTQEILDLDLEIPVDTLQGLQRVRILGKIKDPVTGSLLSGANGQYELSLADEPMEFETLGDESNPVAFKEEKSFLFRGTGEVTDGEFMADLFIPQNLKEDVRKGTIRIMASLQEGREEAIGAKTIPIGGKINTETNDNEGPEIRLLFGEELLESPPLIPSSTYPVKILLSDISGINIAKSVPENNITLQVNDDLPIVLNDSFRASNGGFTTGEILTNLTNLGEGVNRLRIKAWDNVGNASLIEGQIEVRGSLNIKITQLLVYPNPARENSRFSISHNRPGENLNLDLEVYSVKGDIIFKTSRRYPVANAVLDDLEWIFFHNKTKNPAKGMYIYKLQLSSEKDDTLDLKSGKIIIQ